MIRKALMAGFILASFIAGCSFERASKAEVGDEKPLVAIRDRVDHQVKLQLDYSKPVVEMVKANKFASVSKEFQSVQLRKGAEKVLVGVVEMKSGNPGMMAKELVALQAGGYRPANLAEMLALDRSRPELAKHILIAYNPWKRPDGQVFLPYIYADHRGKHLSWRWTQTMPQTYLLVVAASVK